MDPWQTFVVTGSSRFLGTDSFICSGCGEEHLMVR